MEMPNSLSCRNTSSANEIFLVRFFQLELVAVQAKDSHCSFPPNSAEFLKDMFECGMSFKNNGIAIIIQFAANKVVWIDWRVLGVPVYYCFRIPEINKKFPLYEDSNTEVGNPYKTCYFKMRKLNKLSSRSAGDASSDEKYLIFLIMKMEVANSLEHFTKILSL